jgi:hypothetical protein
MGRMPLDIKCGEFYPFKGCGYTFTLPDSSGIFSYEGQCPYCKVNYHMFNPQGIATPLQHLSGYSMHNNLRRNKEYHSRIFRLGLAQFTPNGKLHIVDPESTEYREEPLDTVLMCRFKPKKFTAYNNFYARISLAEIDYMLLYDAGVCKRCFHKYLELKRRRV